MAPADAGLTPMRRGTALSSAAVAGGGVFAGYGHYRSAMRPWWQVGRVMRACGTFDGLYVMRARPEGRRDGPAEARA